MTGVYMTSVYAQADLELKVAPALNLGLVPILGEPLEVFRSELFSRDAGATAMEGTQWTGKRRSQRREDVPLGPKMQCYVSSRAF
jgi:hypothetical protein